MGASGWLYLTSHRGDIASSLAALQEQVFAGRPDLHELLTDFGFTPPLSHHDLAADDAPEELAEWLETEGTHSILDIATMDQVEPLTAEELTWLFGTGWPTRADWDDAAAGKRWILDDLTLGRGIARCAVLYDGFTAAEVVFWGYSGD